MTMENLFQFSVMQFHIVSHTLTLGFAVMLAALLYFAFTYTTALPKYRVSSALSIVVMVSAFLILYHQYGSWVANFSFDPETNMFIKNPDTLFTNGYRYLNWLIDVPMLLLQLTFIVGIGASFAKSARWQFTISGGLMILLGYIGQFYEIADDKSMYWIFFAFSSLFCIHIYWLLYRVLHKAKKDKAIGKAGSKMLVLTWNIFVFSWLLYPIAYLMPVISLTSDAVVWRQVLFTIADISSKVIYGVVLLNLAMLKSKKEGFDYNALKK